MKIIFFIISILISQFIMAQTDQDSIIIKHFFSGYPNKAFIDASKIVASRYQFEMQFEYGSCGTSKRDAKLRKACEMFNENGSAQLIQRYGDDFWTKFYEEVEKEIKPKNVGIKAKRSAPKKANNITDNGITYSAGHKRTTELGQEYFNGVISATNSEGDILWEKTIYSYSYKMTLEKDVQERFIITLKLEEEQLIIETEGSNYLLDIKSKAVIER